MIMFIVGLFGLQGSICTQDCFSLFKCAFNKKKMCKDMFLLSKMCNLSIC